MPVRGGPDCTRLWCRHLLLCVALGVSGVLGPPRKPVVLMSFLPLPSPRWGRGLQRCRLGTSGQKGKPVR